MSYRKKIISQMQYDFDYILNIYTSCFLFTWKCLTNKINKYPELRQTFEMVDDLVFVKKVVYLNLVHERQQQKKEEIHPQTCSSFLAVLDTTIHSFLTKIMKFLSDKNIFLLSLKEDKYNSKFITHFSCLNFCHFISSSMYI